MRVEMRNKDAFLNILPFSFSPITCSGYLFLYWLCSQSSASGEAVILAVGILWRRQCTHTCYTLCAISLALAAKGECKKRLPVANWQGAYFGGGAKTSA